MEGHGRVKGNEAVEEGLTHARNEVPAHGDQEADVGEHDDAGGATNHGCGPGAGETTKSRVLASGGINCNSVVPWC